MSDTARLLRGNDRLITRAVAAAAIAFGAAVPAAAPALADPSPFNTLSSACNETAPTGRDALIRGIHRGLSDWPPSGPHASSRSTCAATPSPTTG